MSKHDKTAPSEDPLKVIRPTGRVWHVEVRDGNHLEKLLSQNPHVNIDEWGKGRAYTVDDLWEEIELGEANVWLNLDSKKIATVVRPSLIDIYYDPPDGGPRETLVELRFMPSLTNPGEVELEERTKDVAASEAGRRDETPWDTALRCLAEEFGWTDLTPEERANLREDNRNVEDRAIQIVRDAGDNPTGKKLAEMIEQLPAPSKRLEATPRHISRRPRKYPGIERHYGRTWFTFNVSPRLRKPLYVEIHPHGYILIRVWKRADAQIQTTSPVLLTKDTIID